MRIHIRYFASVREALGPGETLDVAEGATIAAVRDQLIGRGGAHAEVLARGRTLRAALDQVLCAETETVGDGAEVAFFPPVTGG